MRASTIRSVVTGGSSGIGAAIAEEIENRGGSVVVLDLTPPPTRTEPNSFVECDVADEPSVVRGIRTAADHLGGVDEAYLNAGVGGLHPLLDMPVEEWDRILGVNLRGTFLTLRESARQMVREANGGSIVVTGSVSGFLADRGMAHYNTSKAGAAMLARVAAAELGPRGVRVNVIAPGTTDTPLFAPTEALPGYHHALGERTPLGSVGSAESVARAAVDLARMDWVTGHVLVADGGLSLRSPIDVMEFRPARG